MAKRSFRCMQSTYIYFIPGAMKLQKNIAISESGFVFNPGSGESFILNRTGKNILELLRDNKMFEEIIELMMGEYEVDRIVLEKSILDFISVLKSYGLLEKEPASAN